MIIKYAYSYANPTGTFYMGLRTGVVTLQMSATVMSTIAQRDGGVLCELRRHIEGIIGNDELFELVNVTPTRVTERGIYAPEEIKEIYELCKFDGNLDDALKSYAKQVHEELEKSRDTVGEVKLWIRSLVKADVVVDCVVDDKDPNVMNVNLKIPLPYIEVTLKGVQDGSENRS